MAGQRLRKLKVERKPKWKTWEIFLYLIACLLEAGMKGWVMMNLVENLNMRNCRTDQILTTMEIHRTFSHVLHRSHSRFGGEVIV